MLDVKNRIELIIELLRGGLEILEGLLLGLRVWKGLLMIGEVRVILRVGGRL